MYYFIPNTHDEIKESAYTDEYYHIVVSAKNTLLERMAEHIVDDRTWVKVCKNTENIAQTTFVNFLNTQSLNNKI